ncbi:MAG: hypothetical protein P1V51_07945, partial [Deltaproteobacteria bacterium]|nr:hypothetical protein [Deltaproteobacteria bacterium]
LLAADQREEAEAADRPEETLAARQVMKTPARERQAAGREEAPAGARARLALDLDASKDAEHDDLLSPRATGEAEARADAATERPARALEEKAQPLQPMKSAPADFADRKNAAEGEAFGYQAAPEGGGAGMPSSVGGLAGRDLSSASGSSLGKTSTSFDSLDKGGKAAGAGEGRGLYREQQESRKADSAPSAGASARGRIEEAFGQKAPAAKQTRAAPKPTAAPRAPAGPSMAPPPAPEPEPEALRPRKAEARAKKKSRSAGDDGEALLAGDAVAAADELALGDDDREEAPVEATVETASATRRSPEERVKEQKSDLMRAQLDRAAELVNASRCADALPLLDAIIHQGPDTPWRTEAYFYRGTCRSRLGQESDARSDFALAAAQDTGRWSRKARKQLKQLDRMMLDAAEEAASESAAPAAAEPAMH